MKRLGTCINLIPVIAKADTLTQSDRLPSSSASILICILPCRICKLTYPRGAYRLGQLSTRRIFALKGILFPISEPMDASRHDSDSVHFYVHLLPRLFCRHSPTPAHQGRQTRRPSAGSVSSILDSRSLTNKLDHQVVSQLTSKQRVDSSEPWRLPKRIS